MRHKHLIGILILTLTFAACGRHRQADALLTQADSLMASRPDAAYAMLDSVRDEARGTWGRADRMRYELTLAEAMNKAYVSFTTDSVMKRVARYYDRHGSANQQLKARYLLGCTYRDMGEAPAAINAWQEAVVPSGVCPDGTGYFSKNHIKLYYHGKKHITYRHNDGIHSFISLYFMSRRGHNI